ncbi:hypothetical protein L914_18369 [Phytophthora nicotianae]|uniref:Uncharacterized protein n=1 Tax=Phytophthora nicotianae TaxID=4792 RepID=W2MGE2_PHYNI|nr:hypothetical protein L914_18369 [Phytophthora nicotianae]
MAPTLRSGGQSTSDSVTRPASPQVMSPTRALQAIEEGSGAQCAGSQDQGQVLACQDQVQQTLVENTANKGDATISHEEAEHLIHSLAGIRGGRPLIRVLLEGLQSLHPIQTDDSVPLRNSPPPPPSEPSGDGSSSGSASASDLGEYPRENLHLDNNFPGGRYDDKELVEYTKALRISPAIQLPKLHTKEDYKVWKSEVPLHFEPRTLGDITYGGKRYDVDFGLRRVKYTEWYRARKNKAFSALALSLSVDLRSTFKVDEIREEMEAASILWSFITKHFEAGDGINPDYLLRDLMMRLMQPNDSVTKYAEDIELKVTKLRQAKGDFEEWQQASQLLSNSVLVFPDVTREYAN